MESPAQKGLTLQCTRILARAADRYYEKRIENDIARGTIVTSCGVGAAAAIRFSCRHCSDITHNVTSTSFQERRQTRK